MKWMFTIGASIVVVHSLIEANFYGFFWATIAVILYWIAQSSEDRCRDLFLLAQRFEDFCNELILDKENLASELRDAARRVEELEKEIDHLRGANE